MVQKLPKNMHEVSVFNLELHREEEQLSFPYGKEEKYSVIEKTYPVLGENAFDAWASAFHILSLAKLGESPPENEEMNYKGNKLSITHTFSSRGIITSRQINYRLTVVGDVHYPLLHLNLADVIPVYEENLPPGAEFSRAKKLTPDYAKQIIDRRSLSQFKKIREDVLGGEELDQLLRETELDRNLREFEKLFNLPYKLIVRYLDPFQ